MPGRPGGWAARGETVEAIAWLALARFLIRFVRFGRWRHLLGTVRESLGDTGTVAPDEAFRMARVVERGVMRLPVTARCLPQAMALAWMLRRRAMRPVIVLGALPGQSRGGIDDLHAWVELGGEVLIGASEQAHTPLARFESR